MIKKRRPKQVAPVKPRTRAETRQTRSALVESPYGFGHDRVQRVVDPVEAMAARGQIGDRQKRAAEIYREAYGVAATAGGGIGAERSGGTTRTTLSEAKIDAGRILNEAARLLGVRDGHIVAMVVGEGQTIAEVAGSSASKRDKLHVGRRLTDALALLAREWRT